MIKAAKDKQAYMEIIKAGTVEGDQKPFNSHPFNGQTAQNTESFRLVAICCENTVRRI